MNNEVYTELHKETGDLEMQCLTGHCLRILCCSGAILLHHQFEDQLSSGKFYSPAPEIMNETKNTPKHNILCECDFPQVDRELTKSP